MTNSLLFSLLNFGYNHIICWLKSGLNLILFIFRKVGKWSSKCNATASRTTLKVLEVYLFPIYEIRGEHEGNFHTFYS